MMVPLSPVVNCTSTSTRRASTPFNATVTTLATIAPSRSLILA